MRKDSLKVNTNASDDSKPLISVIVPVYNTAKYLDKCITSIINQTYSNLEIILIDDGSTDDSPAMCDSWAEKDSRVKVIHKQNGGLSSARNAGLDIMSGEFVGFIDSDDSIAPEYYDYLHNLMTEHDADMTTCEFYRFDEKGREIKFPLMHNETLSGEEMLGKIVFSAPGSYINPVNKLYKAALFSELRFPEGFIHEDQFTIHHAAGSCRRVVTSDKKLYLRLLHSESIMGHVLNSFFNIKSFQGHMYAFEDRYNYLLSIGRPDLAEHVLLHSLYSLIINALKKINYLQFRQEINKYLWPTVTKLLHSRRFKNKLRVIKLLLVLFRSLFKPYIKQ
ncbi:MAG: glycosyltransferase [Synergistaceae bacterium]|nr:glycosyltransferase [Synergistaceae bacterium]